MAYGRHSVLSGEDIALRIVLRDDANNLVSADAIPDVYIYDSSVDVETIEAEIDALTFTSALAGPLTPTLISVGFYELTYSVPSGAPEGTWHDVWVGAIDGVDSIDYFSFEVDVGGVLAVQSLLENELILIELDESISNLIGDATLGADQTLAFSTVYNPFYASPDLVRLEIGTFVNYIPDDTLALMIHWSSKEVDFIAKPKKCNTKDFNFARTKFVVYDSALRAILQPNGGGGASGGGNASGTKKQLGDLMIDSGGGTSSTVAVTSSGVDVQTLGKIQKARDEWWRVVNAGGCIVPGQSFDPTFAVKGLYDLDRRNSGRLWLNPELNYYEAPTANTKIRKPGRNRSRFGLSSWTRGGF